MASNRSSSPVGYGHIVLQWLPMLGTWLMMAAEAPFLAAVIARMSEPKENLAAFGVAYAVAILVESPVIMMLSASTALVHGAESLRRLARFTAALNGALTTVMLLLLLTPAWELLAQEAIGLPRRITELSRIGLLLLIPWPAAIGHRRFYQGLLIRAGRTRRVAYGTVTRLLTMATTGSLLLLHSEWTGVSVGAAALSAGVVVEAVASRVMARHEVRRLRGEDDTASAPDYREIISFYRPLALTSMISLAAHPLVTFFMGRARFPLESLAVLPVVNSLTFVFRSVGLSYQEVAIALLSRDERSRGPVLAFAGWLAAAASLAMAAIVFTPLSELWFRGLSGLSAELTRFALPPARILAVIPALSVLLSLQRATLVYGRSTRPITRATMIEILGILVSLSILVGLLDLVGATAAALAFVIGRLAGNLILLPPCRRILATADRRAERLGNARAS